MAGLTPAERLELSRKASAASVKARAVKIDGIARKKAESSISSPDVEEPEQLRALVTPGTEIPYAEIIRSLIEADRIGTARGLLAVALQQEPVDPDCLALARVLAAPTIRSKPATEVDRGREYRWLDAHGSAHRGRWVAVEGDTLLASAATLRDLLGMLASRSVASRPLIHTLTRS